MSSTYKPRNSFVAGLLRVESVNACSVTPPTDPHSTWMGATSLVLGLEMDTVPEWLDLVTPRTMRTIKWEPEIEGKTWPLALFPAAPEHPFVPPYPGQAPVNMRACSDPVTCHTDGGRGRSDPRRYPQPYESACPWMAFFLLPQVLTPGVVRGNVEVLPVTSFFEWNTPGSPDHDGNWIRSLLIDAFCGRAMAEGDLEISIHQIEHTMSQPFDLTPFRLPWYDTTEERAALRWKTWKEGRDSLGRTLLYTAELKAMSRWIAAVELHWVTQKNKTPIVMNAPRLDLMGTWGATILHRSEWEILAIGSAPVYIISLLPDNHPSFHHVKPGNLDGDERFRQNAYDAAHNRMNPFWRFQLHSFENIEGAFFEKSPHQIPLKSSEPQSTPQAGFASTSPFLTWTSCIFSDTTVTRDWRSSMTQKQYMTLRAKYNDRLLFQFLPPMHRILNAKTDPHPLFQVLPSSRSMGITYIQEKRRDSEDMWWAVRLYEKTQVDVAKTTAYLFEYPQERITIYSDFPFPGRDPNLCRRHDDDDECPEIWISPRTYYPYMRRPKLSMPDESEMPAFTWKPSTIVRLPGLGIRDYGTIGPVRTIKAGVSYHPYQAERAPDTGSAAGQHVVLDFPLMQVHTLSPPDPVDSLIAPLGALQVEPDYLSSLPSPYQAASYFPDDFDSPIIEDMSIVNDTDTVMTDIVTHIKSKDPHQQQKQQLLEQRQTLQTQISRRFFKSGVGREDLKSERLLMWNIPNSNGVTGYPVRIANFDGDISVEEAWSWVFQTVAIRRVEEEVLLCAWYPEPDTSNTLELCMRHAEDVLEIHLRMHGVMLHERLLEVTFLKGILGKAYFTDLVDTPEPRKTSDRVHFAALCLDFASYMGENRPMSQLGRDVDNIFCDLAQLHLNETGIQIKRAHQRDRHIKPLADLDGFEVTLVAFPFTQSMGLGTTLAESMVQGSISHVYSGAYGFVIMEPPPKLLLRPKDARPVTGKGRRRTDRSGNDARTYGLFTQERAGLKKAITFQANKLATRWKGLDLPEFHPTKSNNVKMPIPLPQFFKELWDWQDVCLMKLEEFRIAGNANRFDYGPFHSAFGYLSQISSVQGRDYDECLDLWKQRMMAIPAMGN